MNSPPQVKGGILAGIVVVTAIVWGVEKSGPTKIVDFPRVEYGVRDNINVIDLCPEMITAVLAFIFVAIFDMSGQ